MKKNAKRKKPETPKDEIPADLQAQLGSLNALATIHDLLQAGMFTYAHRNAIASSIQFVEILHKQVMSEAKAHPQAHMAPMLQSPKSPEAQAEQDKAFLEVVAETVDQAVQ